jgi:DNA-binding LacI/PurR family transcriptional regulator
VTAHDVRAVAVAAKVDPRTVVRALEGRARAAQREVIAAALRDLGFKREARAVLAGKA